MVNYLKKKRAGIFKGFFLFAFLFLSSCSSTGKNESKFINMNIHDARKEILQNGWKPLASARPYGQIGAAAHYFRDLGYAEVDDCSGSGVLKCLFYYQNKNGEFLKVVTGGEYPDPDFEVQTKIAYAAVLDKID